MSKKIVHVIGGGTVSHVRSHLALCTPAFGTTARWIAEICKQRPEMDVELHLTRMAGGTFETNQDIYNLVRQITDDPKTKIVFFNPALCDFEGAIGDIRSGKDAQRLESGFGREMSLLTNPKIISYVRKARIGGQIPRKDIFLVGWKATSGATSEEQYKLGLRALKMYCCNLILANDTLTKNNIIIVPEEGIYSETKDRGKVLNDLVEMAYLRSQLTFTRSTVIDGKPVAWGSEMIPDSLRTIVDYCIRRGAYKKFLGATAGHFAIKIDDRTFLTSRRKTDFNEIDQVGLVKITTDGPDTVLAYGSKPSVGGQSQRIVFNDHPDMDCIVHFHCPKRLGSIVPTVSQREFECGSHECGRNTSQGLVKIGNLLAVYLDKHGPNIVFNKGIDPKEVITFIENNFHLDQKTGGYQV